MAAAAKMDCYGCGEPVAVRLNRANRAYYHCGHCGLSVVSKDSDSTERMLKKNVIPPIIEPKPTHDTPHEKTTLPTKRTGAGAATVVHTTNIAPKKSAFKTLMDT